MSTIYNKIQNINISKEMFITFLGIIFGSLFTLSLFFTAFNFWIYLFCFAFIAVFIFLYPRAGLYLIVFLTIIFERYFTLTPLVFNEVVYKLYPLDVVIILIILSLLVRHRFSKAWFKHLKADKLFYISLAIFFGILSINFIRTVAMGGDVAIGFSVIKNYIFYSVLFFLTLKLITSQKYLQRLIKTMLMAIIVVLAMFLGSLVSGQSFLTEYIPLSTYGERFLGGGHSFFLALGLLFLINFLVFKTNLGKSWSKYVYWILFFASFFGIVLSLLRHLWLGLILGVIFLFIFYQKKHKAEFLKIAGIVITIVLVLTILLVWFNGWQRDAGLTSTNMLASVELRIKSLFTSQINDESALWREESWKGALRAFTNNPILGIGYGQNLYVELFDFETEIEIRDLHNDYIGMMLQTGILGILAMFWFMIEIIKKFFKQNKKAVQQNKAFLLSAASGIVLFLFSANFGTYFDINLLIIFFYILLGLMFNNNLFVKK